MPTCRTVTSVTVPLSHIHLLHSYFKEFDQTVRPQTLQRRQAQQNGIESVGCLLIQTSFVHRPLAIVTEQVNNVSSAPSTRGGSSLEGIDVHRSGIMLRAVHRKTGRDETKKFAGVSYATDVSCHLV